ncbi:replication associated protein [Lake Sarah-associated circular virus-38]|uniref:Replication-associated protein n=1 Tax=Lake Sarah-associated circular virus-38 TaxID=1685766 RepID=A0A140AQP9_9VIRU|nr:replication associated protein [Lake Sarah-associated circular virus-38]ALE29760.1 replication associated protein [Lake Sarah-associated circular virus-38]
MSNKMAKNWCMTLNNYDDSEVARFESHMRPWCVYYIYGFERGENDTPHLQCFFSLKAKKRMSCLKKIFPRAHFEVKSRASTMEQASDYCKKEENFIEWGVLPDNSTARGLKAISDNYEETVELAKKGDIEAINPEHVLKYYPTIKRIAHDNKKMPSDLLWEEGHPPNIWIYGPTGTGKSYRARAILQENFGQFYSKMAQNKWWDKYDGEEGVLIEDMDILHNYMGPYMKIWADKYAFPVEVKTSGDRIRPKVIVVTSNYTIEQIWPDRSTHGPISRRFKVIHMDQPWNANINQVLRDAPAETSAPREKKRKFDQPLKKPALLRRNAVGDLVETHGYQPQQTIPQYLEPTLEELAEEMEIYRASQDMFEELSESDDLLDL